MIKATKKLGIWMDHSHAHAMEFIPGGIETSSITSKFTSEEKENNPGKNENLVHSKEQHQQSAYYKLIKDNIRNYDEVILFGPTTAKNELANLLKADHHFEKIKVEVKHADKMTENQEHAFIREYFSAHQQ